LDSEYSLKLNLATRTADGGSERLILPVNIVAAHGGADENRTRNPMSRIKGNRDLRKYLLEMKCDKF
jgi:hypothetical protein